MGLRARLRAALVAAELAPTNPLRGARAEPARTSYVALPRLPSIQIAGQSPSRPGLPGRTYCTSISPPVMQNLFHDMTWPEE